MIDRDMKRGPPGDQCTGRTNEMTMTLDQRVDSGLRKFELKAARGTTHLAISLPLTV